MRIATSFRCLNHLCWFVDYLLSGTKSLSALQMGFEVQKSKAGLGSFLSERVCVAQSAECETGARRCGAEEGYPGGRCASEIYSGGERKEFCAASAN